MKAKVLYSIFVVLMVICCRSEDEAKTEDSKVIISENFTGIVDLTGLTYQNIEVVTEADQKDINQEGKFYVYAHSVVLAKNKSLNQPVYFGLPNIDQNVNYQLNAKETALYFALLAVPHVRRLYYKPYLQKLKKALYEYQEVKDLEIKIKESITQYGYLNYDYIGSTLGITINKIITGMGLEKSSYTVDQKVSWNPTYGAGNGFYRCDTIKPNGWSDIYDPTTQTYKLKRKMYNSTAAVVGVQIGKWNESTTSAALSGEYVGFIEPYYPPNLTSLDGTIANFNQTVQAYADWVNNGISGLSNTDAYSKDNEFIFEAKQGSKDAIVFVNGYYDSKMLGLNVAYLFIDNFQDVFEELTGDNFFSKNDFVNDFLGKLMSDQASASDLSNYSQWFKDGNYDLIVDNLKNKLEKYVEEDLDVVAPYKTSLKKGISVGFKMIGGTLVQFYKTSSIATKVTSGMIISSSKKFSAAIPINFTALERPPVPYNPSPYNSSIPVSNNINFLWSISNPTNQNLKYDIYFSSNISDLHTPSHKIVSNLTNTNYSLNIAFPADENRYYWQVETTNQNGLKTVGPIWSFDVGSYPFKPRVGTINASGISNTSATVGGIIHSDGGSIILQKGICYSTTPNPTLANNYSNNGSGDNLYTTVLNNLQQGTAYYIRAYATNNKGTGYGEEYSFFTTGNSNGLGLVALLNFNNSSFNDSSGKNNNAVPNNNLGFVIDVKGNTNGAISFSTMGQQYLTIPNSSTLQFNPNDGYTISFWTRSTNGDILNPNWQTIFEKRISTFEGMVLDQKYNTNPNNGNQFYYYIFKDMNTTGNNNINQYNFYSTDTPQYSGFNLNNFQWKHIVLTVKETASTGKMKIYINGNLYKTDGYLDSPLYFNNTNSANLKIGTYFNGVIDNFRVYNYALNANDILDIYNMEKP